MVVLHIVSMSQLRNRSLMHSMPSMLAALMMSVSSYASISAQPLAQKVHNPLSFGSTLMHMSNYKHPCTSKMT